MRFSARRSALLPITGSATARAGEAKHLTCRWSAPIPAPDISGSANRTCSIPLQRSRAGRGDPCSSMTSASPRSPCCAEPPPVSRLTKLTERSRQAEPQLVPPTRFLLSVPKVGPSSPPERLHGRDSSRDHLRAAAYHRRGDQAVKRRLDRAALRDVVRRCPRLSPRSPARSSRTAWPSRRWMPNINTDLASW